MACVTVTFTLHVHTYSYWYAAPNVLASFALALLLWAKLPPICGTQDARPPGQPGHQGMLVDA